MARDYGAYLLEAMRKWEEYQKQQSELGKKKQFDIGRILPGLIQSSSSGNVAPAVISALGEGLRAYKGSDDDLASVALKAFQEYAPTESPRKDTFMPKKIDMTLPTSQGMLGGVKMPSLTSESYSEPLKMEGVQRQSSPVGNLGAMLQDFMVRPETPEEVEYNKTKKEYKDNLYLKSLQKGKMPEFTGLKPKGVPQEIAQAQANEANKVAAMQGINQRYTIKEVGANEFVMIPSTQPVPWQSGYAGWKASQEPKPVKLDPYSEWVFKQLAQSPSIDTAISFLSQPAISQKTGQPIEKPGGGFFTVREVLDEKGKVNWDGVFNNVQVKYGKYRYGSEDPGDILDPIVTPGSYPRLGR